MEKKKTKRIYLRVNEDSFAAIKKRSGKFQSMTQFIFAAIEAFEDTTIRERLKSSKRLTEYYSKTDEKLAHIGGNLNQAMRRVNEAAIIGSPTQALILKSLMPEIRQCYQVCTQLRRDLTEATHNSVIL